MFFTCFGKCPNIVGNKLDLVLDKFLKFANGPLKGFIFNPINSKFPEDLYFGISRTIFGMNKSESLAQRAQRTILQASLESFP
jgi:hypothetical protein